MYHHNREHAVHDWLRVAGRRTPRCAIDSNVLHNENLLGKYYYSSSKRQVRKSHGKQREAARTGEAGRLRFLSGPFRVISPIGTSAASPSLKPDCRAERPASTLSKNSAAPTEHGSSWK